MAILDKRIEKFIGQHHVLTLATSINNEPWCCSCFYAYIKEENMFVILSDGHTRHVKESVENKKIAGAIALETKVIGKIRGIQFSGTMELLKEKELSKAKRTYLFKFPFALLTKTQVWGLKLTHIKMTDNRLGFGEKIYWNNEK